MRNYRRTVARLVKYANKQKRNKEKYRYSRREIKKMCTKKGMEI